MHWFELLGGNYVQLKWTFLGIPVAPPVMTTHLINPLVLIRNRGRNDGTLCYKYHHEQAMKRVGGKYFFSDLVCNVSPNL